MAIALSGPTISFFGAIVSSNFCIIVYVMVKNKTKQNKATACSDQATADAIDYDIIGKCGVVVNSTISLETTNY